MAEQFTHRKNKNLRLRPASGGSGAGRVSPMNEAKSFDYTAPRLSIQPGPTGRFKGHWNEACIIEGFVKKTFRTSDIYFCLQLQHNIS